MLVEEALSLLHVLALEEPTVGPFEQRLAHPAAEDVADLVAGHRRHEAPDQEERQVEVQRLGDRRGTAGEEAGGEEQRVAGQEEPDEEPGLSEDDEPDADEADLADEVAGVEEPGQQ